MSEHLHATKNSVKKKKKPSLNTSHINTINNNSYAYFTMCVNDGSYRIEGSQRSKPKLFTLICFVMTSYTLSYAPQVYSIQTEVKEHGVFKSLLASSSGLPLPIHIGAIVRNSLRHLGTFNCAMRKHLGHLVRVSSYEGVATFAAALEDPCFDSSGLAVHLRLWILSRALFFGIKKNKKHEYYWVPCTPEGGIVEKALSDADKVLLRQSVGSCNVGVIFLPFEVSFSIFNQWLSVMDEYIKEYDEGNDEALGRKFPEDYEACESNVHQFVNYATKCKLISMVRSVKEGLGKILDCLALSPHLLLYSQLILGRLAYWAIAIFRVSLKTETFVHQAKKRKVDIEIWLSHIRILLIDCVGCQIIAFFGNHVIPFLQEAEVKLVQQMLDLQEAAKTGEELREELLGKLAATQEAKIGEYEEFLKSISLNNSVNKPEDEENKKGTALTSLKDYISAMFSVQGFDYLKDAILIKAAYKCLFGRPFDEVIGSELFKKFLESVHVQQRSEASKKE